MLWVELTGTYKIDKLSAMKKSGETAYKAVYETFRFDFCDMHCLKGYLDTIDMDRIHEAKHKTKKGKKKGA